jgi:hypothetical protein
MERAGSHQLPAQTYMELLQGAKIKININSLKTFYHFAVLSSCR